MASIVVIGGGWAGCAAAVTARQLGGHVTLLERTDMLLGTGLAGGVMRNNGRWTATEEAIAMGGGSIFGIIDGLCRFKNIRFADQENAFVYDLDKIEPGIRRFMSDLGINMRFESRVTDVYLKGKEIEAVVLNNDKGKTLKGDVFVEATGSAGPLNICSSYGNGCVMCVLRCHSFGGRVSVALKAGVKETDALGSKDSIRAMSGSCLVSKGSLSTKLVRELEEEGMAIVKIPERLRTDAQSDIKACPQYGGGRFTDSLIVLNAGFAKLMVPYFPLDKLRKLPGFEKARYIDPLGGTKGNSVRYASISPRENSLKVRGIDNLFCGGEKTGPVPGHTEAIITGILAGHNSVRASRGKPLLILPREVAIGDFISFVGEQMMLGDVKGKRFTFSGSIYFERMEEIGSYTTSKKVIKGRIRKTDLKDIFLHL